MLSAFQGASLGNKPDKPASSQSSCWDSDGRSSSLQCCEATLQGSANTTWSHVRAPQGLTLPPHPEDIARSGKAIATEGAGAQTRGTAGEHAADFCLSPIRLAFSSLLSGVWCLQALGNICSLHSFQWSVGKALTRNKKTREFAFKSILLTLFLSK